MNILLVEDQTDYVFIVREMLQQEAVTTVAAVERLDQALDYLTRQTPELILLDLSLPDSHGLDTLIQLRRHSGEIPIIVLTGTRDEQLAIEAVRRGAQDYLVKGEIDKRGLIRAIRYATQRGHAEHKYRELVESIDAIVWDADPVTWRFTFVSKAAEKILGYPIERWLRDPNFWVNLIHPDDRPRAVEYCQRQVEKGDNHEFEYRVVALDGRVVWLRDIVRVIKNESGQPINLRGVMIDITQSKDAAAEVQQHHYEIQSLQEISQLILEAAEPNAGIQKALEKSIAVGGFDFGDVLLTTPQGELISVVAACGFRDPANRLRIPRPETPTHRCVLLQQSSVIENLQKGDRHRSFKREGAETAVIVPLRAGNVSLGLLQLASRRAKEIRPNELALAEAVGRQIGIAIQKAQLYEEIRRNLDHIQSMREFEHAVLSTLDLSAVLNLLLGKMDTFFPPGSAFTIQSVNSETGRFEYLANCNLNKEAWMQEYGDQRTISGNGLTRWALESSAPLEVSDLQTDPRVAHPGFMRKQGLVSYLGVQLRIKDKPMGIVGVYTRIPHQFSAEETSYIASLASQAAIAIHNASLYAEVDKKSQELAALFDVSSAASQSLDVDFILHEVARRISEIFSFDATRVLLFDEHKQQLLLRASYETQEDFTASPKVFLKGQGISGHAAATGEAIVFENIDTDPRYEEITYKRTAVRTGQKFAASFPIKYQDEVLGVITCVGLQPRRLTDHELRLISSMSSQIAVAVNNAQLYAEREKQTRELGALFDVTTAATQSLEMDRVLEEVIRRINEIFLFDATRFFLFDNQHEWLHCRATHHVHANFLTRTHSFKIGQGITGRVGATGTAIIFDDTKANPQYQLLSLAKKTGHRFVAGFPVKYGSETLGVIMCMGEQPRQLTKHETDLIASLSSQIAVAIANARLYEQTKDQAEQLRNLTTHLESVREEERRRISREIHDELGQALTALKFDASWIKGKLSNQQPALADRLTEMSALIDDTIQAIRKIAARLRPDILDKLGLAAAMEWQLQEFRKRTGIKYHFASHPSEIRLHEQQSTALFRILQEALTNVARHSAASRVRIALELQNTEVSLRIDDDGGGIEDEKIFDARSLGLLGMRERAVALGGSITVQRNDHRGTTVIAHLPMAQLNESVEIPPRSMEL